jgi:hypothetical protein
VDILEALVVRSGHYERRIEVVHGDLAHMPRDQVVDVLIVSAFPDDYFPTPTSLIGALDRAGVSVMKLARDKEEDLRAEYGCWLSRPVARDSSAGFRRILCFEPALRGSPPEVVGDIFRCLSAIVHGSTAMSTVAMPLVASGDARWPREAIFGPLVDAAVHWLELGLQIDVIRIVERAREKAEMLAAGLTRFRRERPGPQLSRTRGFYYDVFLSYSRPDQDAANFLASELQKHESHPRIFQDTLSIDPGASWQQKIWEALEACRRIVALYSPTYLASKACQEEYAIARLREQNEGGVLVPLYLKTATLPAYIRILNYVDCREADFERLRAMTSMILKT